MHTISSEIERTINSAALVLAALFPPKNDQIWNKHLLWQPIPVYAIPKHMDSLIVAEKQCDRYQNLIKEFEKTPEVQALYQKNQALFEYLEQHAGIPIRTIEQLKDLHGTLDVERMMNKT